MTTTPYKHRYRMESRVRTAYHYLRNGSTMDIRRRNIAKFNDLHREYCLQWGLYLPDIPLKWIWDAPPIDRDYRAKVRYRYVLNGRISEKTYYTSKDV